MNKHLKSLMIAAVAVMSIVGCKKDKTEDLVNNSDCKLSEINVIYNGIPDEVYKFAYDNSCKIISTDTDGDLVSYVYNGDKVAISSQHSSHTITISNGRVIRSEPANSNTYTNYVYNADGNLSMTQTYEAGILTSTEALTYTNGNLTKIVDTRSYGTASTTNYEFSNELSSDLTFIDPLVDILDNEFPSGGFYGKLSKNLVVKSKRETTFPSGDVNSRTESFTYEKDTFGKVISKTNSRSSTTYRNGVVLGTPTSSIEKFVFSFICK